MPFKTVTEKPDYYMVPPGTYILRCEKVEETNHEQYGPGVRWTFSLPDPDDKEVAEGLKENDQNLSFTTGYKFNKGSKTILWAEALNGAPFAEGDNWWEVEGRIAQGTIVHRAPKNNPTGEVRFYLDALTPVKSSHRKELSNRIARATAGLTDDDEDEVPTQPAPVRKAPAKRGAVAVAERDDEDDEF